MVRNLELRALWRREFITPDCVANQLLFQLGATWTVLGRGVGQLFAYQ